MKDINLLMYDKEFIEILQNKNISLKSKEYISNRIEVLNNVLNYQYLLNKNKNLDEIDKDLIKIDKYIRNLNKKIDNKLTCIILCYNEEKYIETCIKSIINSVDEIIIIDTGSTDNSLNIINNINSEKIKLYHYVWNDSFANARNFGVSKASKSWILFIDADEQLSSEYDYKKLHNLILGFNDFPYRNRLVISPIIIDVNTNQKYIDIDRIFYKDSNLEFYGNVHEELRSKNGPIIKVQINVSISHIGYLNNSIKEKNKIPRNLLLLEKVMKREPSNPRWAYFYIKDGFSFLDDSLLLNTIYTYILKDKNNKLNEDNLIIHQYTYYFLNVYCKVCLKKSDFKEIYNAVNLMDNLYPNSSDAFYYRLIIKYVQVKAMIQEMLNETLNYRKNHLECQPYMSSTEGYHIDFLIALFLYETGNFELSKKYFSFLKDKFYDINLNHLIDTYYKMLTSMNY